MNEALRRSRLQRWLIAWNRYKMMSGDAAVKYFRKLSVEYNRQSMEVGS